MVQVVVNIFSTCCADYPLVFGSSHPRRSDGCLSLGNATSTSEVKIAPQSAAHSVHTTTRLNQRIQDPCHRGVVVLPRHLMLLHHELGPFELGGRYKPTVLLGSSAVYSESERASKPPVSGFTIPAPRSKPSWASSLHFHAGRLISVAAKVRWPHRRCQFLRESVSLVVRAVPNPPFRRTFQG